MSFSRLTKYNPLTTKEGRLYNAPYTLRRYCFSLWQSFSIPHEKMRSIASCSIIKMSIVRCLMRGGGSLLYKIIDSKSSTSLHLVSSSLTWTLIRIQTRYTGGVEAVPKWSQIGNEFLCSIFSFPIVYLSVLAFRAIWSSLIRLSVVVILVVHQSSWRSRFRTGNLWMIFFE